MENGTTPQGKRRTATFLTTQRKGRQSYGKRGQTERKEVSIRGTALFLFARKET